MNQSVLILFAIFVPIIWGVYILAKKGFKTRKSLITTAAVGLVITTILSLIILVIGDMQLHLFAIGENMNIYFHADKMGRIFMTIVTIVLPLVG
ncbi:MAG: hypothetical protein J6I97_02720, partial [Agathobacter sp.]|nr:hypothetical protein [Agathobacter sp.]